MNDEKLVKSVIRRGRMAQERQSSIATALVKGLQSQVKLKRNHLHGKDGAYCSRQAALFILVNDEYTGKIDAASELYMAIGTAMHEVVTKAFHNAGILLATEFRINNMSIAVGGKVDDIVNDEGELRIIEVKTCGGLPGAPKADHLTQAIVYSLATGIRKVTLLYISRSVADFNGKLKMIDFDVPITEDDYFRVATNLFISYYTALRKRMPPIPLEFTGPNDCGFCPFKSICWGEAEPPAKELTAKQFGEVLAEAKRAGADLCAEMEDRLEQTKAILKI